MGYLSMKPEQVNAFFKLLYQRYGTKSTIITTNLDYPEWYELFGPSYSAESVKKELMGNYGLVYLFKFFDVGLLIYEN